MLKQWATQKQGKQRKQSKTQVKELRPSELSAYWATFPSSIRVLPFYGQTNRQTGFLSNFYPSPFKYRLPPNSLVCPGKVLVAKHAEQAIMLSKAALFGDMETFDRIRRCSSPASCKRLGRQVQHFDEAVWAKNVIAIAVRVLWHKFKAGGMKDRLIGTGGHVLAEASPRDRIWGIGAAASDSRSQDIRHWRGSNLLGYALMKTRSRLSSL